MFIFLLPVPCTHDTKHSVVLVNEKNDGEFHMILTFVPGWESDSKRRQKKKLCFYDKRWSKEKEEAVIY